MRNRQKASAASSVPSASAPVEHAAATNVPEEGADHRLERIMEYLQVSLHKQDALQANLSAANADLMMIGYRLAMVIKAAMAAAPPSLEAYEDFGPAIGNLLRIHKLVDRFSALDSRLASAKGSMAFLQGRAAAAIEQSEDLKN